MKRCVLLLSFLFVLRAAAGAQPPASGAPRPAPPWSSKALETPYRENLSDDEKVAGLSKFWAEVRFNFANFDLVPGLDWDALYLAYLPKVRQTRSTREYYQVLQELCARLKDGHTNVVPPKEIEETLDKPPLRTEVVEGKVLITRVASDRLIGEGVRAGLEIVAVDGLPVQQYVQEQVAPYQSSSTPQDLEVRSYGYSFLMGPESQPVALTLRDEKGNVFQKSVRRSGYDDLKPSRPLLEFKILEGNVAYVALNSFADESLIKLFEDAFPKIQTTGAMILDLRQNGGGDSSIGDRILAHLTDRSFKGTRWRTREYVPAYRAWGREEGWHTEAGDETPGSPGGFYGKPVVLLVGPRTFSAGEDFAVTFDAMQRGRIVGEPTGGSTGQPLPFNLPGGGWARVCTKRDTYPDGREFVGRGVQPRIVIHPTVSDVRAGRDTVLEAALRELRQPSQ
jgi:carboxyl-terminal processing protease